MNVKYINIYVLMKFPQNLFMKWNIKLLLSFSREMYEKGTELSLLYVCSQKSMA